MDAYNKIIAEDAREKDAALVDPGKQIPLWTGESKKKSVIGNWQRALKKLFKLAKVPNGHAWPSHPPLGYLSRTQGDVLGPDGSHFLMGGSETLWSLSIIAMVRVRSFLSFSPSWVSPHVQISSKQSASSS